MDGASASRALVAGLLFVSAAAFAQTGDADTRALFDRLDRNHDGYLTPDELAGEAARENSWLAVDRNGDGRISREEFTIVRRLAGTPASQSAAGGTAPSAKDEAPSKDAARP